MKILFLLLLSVGALGQDAPKGSNQIRISGLTFSAVITGLIDKGFTIEKIDSNSKTATTGYKNVPMPNGKESLVFSYLNIKVQDTVVVISGKWYNSIHHHDGPQSLKPGDIYDAEWTSGAPKLVFKRMDEFAKSLGKIVEYAISK